ncbi:MAG: LysM peptidoglycan-binding domain-containing protein, partial [Anaerolineales bacterium]|nr:LysM peptidoglycan-binding domain-containing protein [Anaerolineales bacterium]
MVKKFRSKATLMILAAAIGFAAFGCSRTRPSELLPTVYPSPNAPRPGSPTRTPFLPPTAGPNDSFPAPTPDPSRILPTPRLEPDEYVTQSGDSLGGIARLFGVSLNSLIAANEIPNPDIVPVGQLLTIPPPELAERGPAFKIIPDSELVYGPFSAYVDYEALVRSRGGFLAGHEDKVDDQTLSGLEIIRRVAGEYSVNPLLLITLLEHQSGWVTRDDISEEQQLYPMGLVNSSRKGLYNQLAWAANELNRGYYLWRVNAMGALVMGDGAVVPLDPTINAGTAAVQYLLSTLYSQPEWRQAVSSQGVFSTYSSLFGFPFNLAFEPLIPPDLQQPPLQLPFNPGDAWSYTGGPHGGYGSGSAWAALDFAPSYDDLGCNWALEWVTAVADGQIVRAENGSVVQDLDGDGYEQTGWTILYLHIATTDRVPAGAVVKAGDRIGHPSCEGGVSTG